MVLDTSITNNQTDFELVLKEAKNNYEKEKQWLISEQTKVLLA
jgi:hypothetical protein